MATHLLDTRLHHLGRRDYEPTWRAMQQLTAQRDGSSADELWLVEHPPVFTLGQAGRTEHLLDPGSTPVIRSDRGGQVTWHGPGQIVLYALLDLRRRGLSVRDLVTCLEQAVVSLLAVYGIASQRRPDAPGVYVDGAKIAALGVRVRNGRCYHGLAFNVCNDLAPFARINPCGYAGLATTRFYDLNINVPNWTTYPPLERLEVELAAHLLASLDAPPGSTPTPPT
ncbi:octanoyltransferase [Halorhodospira abdelmalekii]|uniref:lipoyl(octanoyl) transferase LipB n=1 Tax=Halorhodospira abdelmalekii TaxID=421629 RepID=UPI0019051057|nr:lipoyl(octanoyl) transferase LipB [Halorhodospira abdelmalekii]MBK1734020.1 octanoyltransferase [Halorhodospira abdelmalekii]